jgi:hypothetical protein
MLSLPRNTHDRLSAHLVQPLHILRKRRFAFFGFAYLLAAALLDIQAHASRPDAPSSMPLLAHSSSSSSSSPSSSSLSSSPRPKPPADEAIDEQGDEKKFHELSDHQVEDFPESVLNVRSVRQKMKEQVEAALVDPKTPPRVTLELKQLIRTRKKEDLRSVPRCVGSLATTGAIGYASNASPGCGMLLGSLVFPFMAEGIKNIKYTLSCMTRDCIPSRERSHRLVLDVYELYYVLMRNSIPEYTRKRLEKRFEVVRDLINSYTAPLFGDFGERKSDYPITEKLEKIERILQIPFGQVSPVHDMDKGTRELKEHLSTYDTGLKEHILRAFKTIADTARLEPIRLSNGDVITRRQHYYFLGQPGVGKTVTARALAKASGLPFCELSLDELFSDEDLAKGVQETALSKLTKCFIQSDNGISGINPIIYIDEPDRTANEKGTGLLGRLLTLLNSGEAYFDDRNLDVRIPLDRATFIFSGNETISDKSGALGTRFITMTFPNLTLTQKQAIAASTLRQLFDTLPIRIRPREVPPEAMAKLTEIAGLSGEVVDEKKDDRADEIQPLNEPGVRVMGKVINQLFFHIVEQKTIAQFDVPAAFRVYGRAK